MAALIALALFVAQAINFALALRDRGEFRLMQATRPVAIRLADALEREAQSGRPLRPDRGRVRRVAADPVPAGLVRRTDVVTELRRELLELGIAAGRIDTGLQAWRPRPWRRGRPDGAFGGPPGEQLLIAVEQPGRGWLVTQANWPEAAGRLLFTLIGQTLILYAVILAPVLWAARRLSRPLRDLAAAAAAYDPAAPATPVAAAGPDDLRHLIAAFNALRLRVTAMLDEKDRMLGAIGHDLRTPLAALRVRIESVDDEGDRARMADTIAEMSRTLDDILSLARIGRPSEAATEVDLAALVDAVVEDFRDLGQPVSLAEADRLPMRLRPALLRRAIRNLIENAVKYGERAEVRIEAAPTRVAVVVADHGPGIPADRLDAVFDPFTRLEGSRNRDTGGVGLGLALARSIVRDAGGEIVLANRPGGGLDAAISLPR